MEDLLSKGHAAEILENKEFFNVSYFARKLGKVQTTLLRGNLTLEDSRKISMFFAKAKARFVKACDGKKSAVAEQHPFTII